MTSGTLARLPVFEVIYIDLLSLRSVYTVSCKDDKHLLLTVRNPLAKEVEFVYDTTTLV
jgi:hypothetical protein